MTTATKLRSSFVIVYEEDYRSRGLSMQDKIDKYINQGYKITEDYQDPSRGRIVELSNTYNN